MTFPHRTPARWLVALAFLALAAPLEAQRQGGTLKKGPPPLVTGKPPAPAEPVGNPATASPAGPKDRARLSAALRGVDSGAAENEGGESDPPFDPFAWVGRGKKAPSSATASLVRLADHPKRDELVRWLVDSLSGREIDVALLGGKKYMINSCLGIKASAGTFRIKLAVPRVDLDGTGIVVRFAIEHVSISAIKLRMRPNANILEPCSFSKKFEVGGSMEDVRLTLRFDPLYDVERCRLGAWTDLNPEVRIGNLNLKPLQNDLDRMAKNLIEDSLTVALQLNVDGVMSGLGELLLSSIDQFLEADCPTKPGDTARAIDRIGRGLGGLGGGGSARSPGAGGAAGGSNPAPSGGSPGRGSGSGGGGAAPSGGPSAPSSWSPQDVAALLARIEALEERIAELEAGGGASADAEDVLELALERLGGLDVPGGASDALGELLAQLLARVLERSPSAERDAFVERVVALSNGAPAPAARPAAGADAAPWHLVPNPELRSRMGRVVVRFPDAGLAGGTLVALHRDGKKVADSYGEASWEVLAGAHDVVVTNVPVPGCEVRAGHDTLVRVGVLQIELAGDTLVTLFQKGGSRKIGDHYGSWSVGLPAGGYEVEIHGQRAEVEVLDGRVTRF